ncbi:MAG TPA: asparaginase, partial [Holophaga sp.]|nr:asparaginase [Holophaga sp.]
AQTFALLADPSALPEPRRSSLQRIFRSMAANGDMVAGPGRFDTLLMQTAGGKIACRDASMATALQASGVAMDPGAKVAWASSPAEAKVLKGMGKMVISGRPEMLTAGAAVAIVEDGGKPKILLHRANLAASGVAVSDAILKVGEVL